MVYFSILYTSLSSNFTRSFRACRNGRRRCSVRKHILTNFSKFTEKHLCQGLFFNKVIFSKKKTLAQKILRTAFLQNTSGGWFWACFDYIDDKVENYIRSYWTHIEATRLLKIFHINGIFFLENAWKCVMCKAGNNERPLKNLKHYN